ncbi:hypothetical protein WA026_015484 [Henosepilachna vigintioctopunctata]|uniref:Uncharacterized protein n=1 Tax=Henosepilachna vigintioctopunctata TaxID=420089 RepID=A0AAW1UMY4_9CUCU
MEYIENIILNLKTEESAEINGITVEVIKTGVEALSAPLTSTLTTEWKMAFIQKFSERLLLLNAYRRAIALIPSGNSTHLKKTQPNSLDSLHSV